MRASNAPDLSRSNATSLSTLLESAVSFEERWSDKDLAAILKHQLSAPIEFDLENLPAGQFGQLAGIAASQRLLLRSFGDLFLHENPPLDLLVRTKDFVKRLRTHPNAPVPKDVCSILYFAAIAVALIRHKRRITKLDDCALHAGFLWGASCDWAPQQVRQLLTTADEML